jgi:hypothetical protein
MWWQEPIYHSTYHWHGPTYHCGMDPLITLTGTHLPQPSSGTTKMQYTVWHCKYVVVTDCSNFSSVFVYRNRTSQKKDKYIPIISCLVSYTAWRERHLTPGNQRVTRSVNTDFMCTPYIHIRAVVQWSTPWLMCEPATREANTKQLISFALW